MYSSSIITISDKIFTGEIKDMVGERVLDELKNNRVNVISYSIVPNSYSIIKSNIIKCCDQYKVDILIIIGLELAILDEVKLQEKENELYIRKSELFNFVNRYSLESDNIIRNETIIINL